MKANLLEGCWILFAAMLVAILIIQLVTRSCAQALNERLQQLTKDSEVYQTDAEDSISLEDGHETCIQRCNQRNALCNDKCGVGFFSTLAAIGLVQLGQTCDGTAESTKCSDDAYEIYDD